MHQTESGGEKCASDINRRKERKRKTSSGASTRALRRFRLASGTPLFSRCFPTRRRRLDAAAEEPIALHTSALLALLPKSSAPSGSRCQDPAHSGIGKLYWQREVERRAQLECAREDGRGAKRKREMKKKKGEIREVEGCGQDEGWRAEHAVRAGKG